jgi:hypothetical protein
MATPRIDWEPINGNIIQSISYCRAVFEPSSGSWIQAICEALGYTEAINGFWEYTLLYDIYLNSDFIDGPLPTLVNGNIWQTIWYYIGGETAFNGWGMPGINYAINGSWLNNYFQYICSSTDGIPLP